MRPTGEWAEVSKIREDSTRKRRQQSVPAPPGSGPSDRVWPIRRRLRPDLTHGTIPSHRPTSRKAARLKSLWSPPSVENSRTRNLAAPVRFAVFVSLDHQTPSWGEARQAGAVPHHPQQRGNRCHRNPSDCFADSRPAPSSLSCWGRSSWSPGYRRHQRRRERHWRRASTSRSSRSPCRPAFLRRRSAKSIPSTR